MYLLHILESFEAICCILFVLNLFLICSWSPFLEKIQGSTRPAIHSSQENFRVQCECCILFRQVQFYGEEITSFFADYWLLLFWVMAIDIPFNLIFFIWLANSIVSRRKSRTRLFSMQYSLLFSATTLSLLTTTDCFSTRWYTYI